MSSRSEIILNKRDYADIKIEVDYRLIEQIEYLKMNFFKCKKI